MNILTKRNGIALVAVLAILLVLTLLLPVMFSMSENAMQAAMTGTDEQRASYLARTMVEFSVAAFQSCYDGAEKDEADGVVLPEDLSGVDKDSSDLLKLNKFLKVDKSMTISIVYMYRDKSVTYPQVKPYQDPTKSDAENRNDLLENEYKEYLTKGIIYSSLAPDGWSVDDLENNIGPYGKTKVINNITYECLGYATCDVVYNDTIEYFITKKSNGVWKTEKITDGTGETQYKNHLAAAKEAIKNGDDLTNSDQVFRVQNNKVEFSAVGHVNDKGAKRKCIVVLPTKPAENNWIVPANIESNQIFPDTSQCSGVTALSIKNTDYMVDKAAIQGQPVYGFSCVGNMVLSTKKIKYKISEEVKVGNDTQGYYTVYSAPESADKPYYVDCIEYVRKYNSVVDSYNANVVDVHNQQVQANIDNDVDNPGEFWEHEKYINTNIEDFSLGLHPETTTINPERDPFFNCLKTNNMRTWASQATRDNFVAFTATNGIQIDMPVNVIMNPCRTGRIGDGIDRNQSLYKVLYLQAPSIVFNDTVNSFISLYTKTSATALLFDYNAYRMSSIVLAAPENTPYTMEILHTNAEGKKSVETVKAGKVYFAEDAYIWLVPFTENGSNYRTQTVYYKGKDIILYKFANAGDVFLFNAEKKTLINGEMKKAGFSMTGYFMDVIYNEDSTQTNNTPWWDLWSGIQNLIFDTAVDKVRAKTYDQQDLQWIGNMNTGSQSTPNVDDFYVIWES